MTLAGMPSVTSIDLDRFNSGYDRDFYRRNNLGAVTYFDKNTFGEDKVVRHPFCNKGKKQLLRVLNGGLHSIQVPEAELQSELDCSLDYTPNKPVAGTHRK